MKKVILSAIIIISLLALAGTTFAAKPAGNLAGAQKVAWNLSAAVMPVPPYGSLDILGSDTASKLIVNRPNGAVKATITGAMNGLHPNTTYTVYLSNGYTPYKDTGWNVTGNWGIAINYLGTDYVHTAGLVQETNTSIAGTLVYSGYTKTIISGSVTGNAITIVAEYEGGSGTLTLTGTIANDGSMSGNWSDTWGGLGRTGTWTTTGGPAVKTHTGDTGWTGLFTNTVQPFTFTTDNTGSGSWHVNLRAGDFPGVEPYKLSVWINEAGGTMLISNNFELVKD